MIFRKPKDAKPFFGPQIPLVPQPWLPWLLILRTGFLPHISALLLSYFVATDIYALRGGIL